MLKAEAFTALLFSAVSLLLPVCGHTPPGSSRACMPCQGLRLFPGGSSYLHYQIPLGVSDADRLAGAEDGTPSGFVGSHPQSAAPCAPCAGSQDVSGYRQRTCAGRLS